MTADTESRARNVRRCAERLGLRLSQRGVVFRLGDTAGATIEVGSAAAVGAYLGQSYAVRRPQRGVSR